MGSFAFRSLTFKLFAFIPKDSITTITVCFHIHALLVIPVESEWHWCAIKLIVAPKNWLNGLSCFLCMVMWHCWKHMMCDMSIRNVMKHVIQDPIVPIHSSKSSTNPVPFCIFIMRQSWMSVLQISNEDKKHVNYQEWNSINFKEPQETISRSKAVETKAYEKQSNITEDDLKLFSLAEDWTAWIKMGSKLRVRSPWCVANKICRPSK